MLGMFRLPWLVLRSLMWFILLNWTSDNQQAVKGPHWPCSNGWHMLDCMFDQALSLSMSPPTHDCYLDRPAACVNLLFPLDTVPVIC